MQSRRIQFGLLGSFLAIGSIAVVLQTLLLREFLVVFAGNELGLSLVFACWLLGVTSGAFAGSVLCRFLRTGIASFLAVLLMLVGSSPFFLYLVRLIRTLFEIPIGQYPPFFDLAAATFVVAAPAAFPIGLLFPFAGRVAQHLGFGEKSIGSLYTYEAIGATLGGIIYTFVLAGAIDSFNSLAPFLLMGLIFATAFLYFLRNRRFLIPFFIITVGLGIVFALGLFTGLNRQSTLARWTSIAPGLTLLESVDSRYQNLEVGQLAEQVSVYGNGEVFTSFPDERTFQIEANLIACQHPAPKSALVFGAGAEGMVRHLLLHGIAHLDYVETDAKAMSLIDRYLPEEDKHALKDRRVRRIATDGRYFVRNTENRYDLIILHLLDPSTAMINRFYTLEFFEQIRNILNPGGVCAFTLTSAVNYVGEEIGLYVGSIYNTVKRIYPNIVILPGDTARFFLSPKIGSCTDDWTILQQRYRERGLPEDDFSTVMFKILMPPERIEIFRKGLDSYGHARVNRDARPVTYFYNLLLWDQFSQGQLRPYLDFLSRIGAYSVLIIIISGGIAFSILLILLRKAKPKIAYRVNAAVIIFATGFAGMSLEIVLLLAFQSAQGALYERIGLFVALYMLGLAIGGGFATRRLGGRAIRISRWIFATEFLLVLLPLSIIHWISMTLPGPAYYCIVLLVGIGAGVQFPIAGALAGRKDENMGSIAGLIDWADHLGAFAGAAVTGIFFIPLFGLPKTCLIIAVLKAASLIASLPVARKTIKSP